jgi:hypothetical protein
MGFKKFIRNVGRQVEDQVKRAEDPNRGVWGDSPYSRYAERLLGAATFKKAISRQREDGGAPLDSGNPYIDAKEDARLGRPTLAYSAAINKDPAEKIAQEARADASRMAYQNSVIQAANDRAARLSRDVRIRRRAGDANRPGNKNGTLLTGALGLLSGTSSTLG